MHCLGSDAQSIGVLKVQMQRAMMSGRSKNAKQQPTDHGPTDHGPPQDDSSSDDDNPQLKPRTSTMLSPVGLQGHNNWLLSDWAASPGTWIHKITGIDRHAGIGHQRSKLLHPDFPFVQYFNIISTFLLIYVALVVQVEVGFFWQEGLCQGEKGAMQYFDVFVDCFFILEILLKFFTGVFVEGQYIDEYSTVACTYIQGGML